MKTIKEFFIKLGFLGAYSAAVRIAALAVVPFAVIGSGYMILFTNVNFFSVLAAFGLSALPKIETMLLSLLYNLTKSEMLVLLIILAVAFFFGLTVKKLSENEKAKKITTLALTAIVAADVVIRCLPLEFNFVFGVAAYIFGLVFRVGCLALLIAELVKSSKKVEKNS